MGIWRRELGLTGYGGKRAIFGCFLFNFFGDLLVQVRRKKKEKGRGEREEEEER